MFRYELNVPEIYVRGMNVFVPICFTPSIYSMFANYFNVAKFDRVGEGISFNRNVHLSIKPGVLFFRKGNVFLCCNFFYYTYQRVNMPANVQVYDPVGLSLPQSEIPKLRATKVTTQCRNRQKPNGLYAML